MKFLNTAHKEFYEEQIKNTKSEDDPYRKAFFYTTGINELTRKNIKDLYDFKENCIEYDGLNGSWQTSESIKISRLALNLYNGYCGECGDNDNSKYYSPYELFSYVSEPVRIFMLEAVSMFFSGF